jgi:F-type H+-transporting ATPase subunit epsilon
MKLKILLPDKIFLDSEIDKLIAESPNGSFCLLPRHIDFLSALSPSLLVLTLIDGQEKILAVDGGILVKKGNQIWISSQHCLEGNDLKNLQQTIKEEFQKIDEQEKINREALAKLEVNLVRHYVQMKKDENH